MTDTGKILNSQFHHTLTGKRLYKDFKLKNLSTGDLINLSGIIALENNEALYELIDTLLIGESILNFTLTDRTELIYLIRLSSFDLNDQSIKYSMNCRECKKPFEYALSPEELSNNKKPLLDNYTIDGVEETLSTGRKIIFKLPTVADELEVLKTSESIFKTYHPAVNPANEEVLGMIYIARLLQGEESLIEAYNGYIMAGYEDKKLVLAEVREISTLYEKYTYGFDAVINASCPHCEAVTPTMVDLNHFKFLP